MSLVQLPQQVERWSRAPRQGTSPHCDILTLTSDQLWLAVWILSEHLDISPQWKRWKGRIVSVKHMFVECDTGHKRLQYPVICSIYLNIWLIYVLACMVGSQPMDCSILCIFAMRSQQKRMLRLSRWRIAARFCPTALVPCPELLAAQGLSMAPGLITPFRWRENWYNGVFGSPMSLILFEWLLSEQRSEDGIQIFVALFYVRVFTVKPTKVGWILGKGSISVLSDNLSLKVDSSWAQRRTLVNSLSLWVCTAWVANIRNPFALSQLNATGACCSCEKCAWNQLHQFRHQVQALHYMPCEMCETDNEICSSGFIVCQRVGSAIPPRDGATSCRPHRKAKKNILCSVTKIWRMMLEPRWTSETMRSHYIHHIASK